MSLFLIAILVLVIIAAAGLSKGNSSSVETAFNLDRDEGSDRSANGQTFVSDVDSQLAKRSGPNLDEIELSWGPENHPMLIKLLPAEFVVLDIETTGIDRHQNEIIELGAIRVSLKSERHATFQSFIRIKRTLPPEITQLTGITFQMLEEYGLDSREALKHFLEFIGDLPIVAFNASFDIEFLQNIARKHGMVITNRYTCALRSARRAWPDFESHKLVALSKRLKLPQTNHHRALGDSLRAAHVFTRATLVIGTKARWRKPSAVAGERSALLAGK